jgi:hypothetical protein
MYRGKIIWKRPYESDLKTRHDEEIQQAYLKRKRTTKRAGRILFVRAENQGGATTTTSSQQNQRKSSSARDALELAIARSKNRTSKIKHKIMVATPESFLKRIEPSRDESNSGLTFTFVRNTTSRDQPKYVYVTCIFGDSKTRADMIAHAVRVMGPDICYNNDTSSLSKQQLQQSRRRSSVHPHQHVLDDESDNIVSEELSRTFSIRNSEGKNLAARVRCVINIVSKLTTKLNHTTGT